MGILTSEIKKAQELGTLDSGVLKLVDKLIQKPTDFMTFDSSSLAKINAFDKYVTSDLEDTAANLKLRKTGSNIGRNK